MTDITPEQIEALLEFYETHVAGCPYRDIQESHLASFWHGVLKGLVPTNVSYSLHVLEHTYNMKAQRFVAFWEISCNDEVPFAIHIYKGKE
jgi:hypothetical protein